VDKSLEIGKSEDKEVDRDNLHIYGRKIGDK
jgi:hypothetical protein